MSENVNPLSLIRAFGQWCEVNHLDPMTKLLWYELYQLFNRLGWPEWVQIDLPRLAVMIGSKREQTAIGHRDTLISRGLLGYRKGGKGDPSRYNLKCPTLTVGQSVGKSVGKSVGESVGKSVGESATIYRLRQDKDVVDVPRPRNAWASDGEMESLAADLDAVLDAAAAIGIPQTHRDIDRSNALAAEYSAEWVREALRRAGEAPGTARCWRYVEGILKGWRQKGGIDSPTRAQEPEKPSGRFWRDDE